MESADVLLIGVDGGATEVKAHAVACDDLEKPSSFELQPKHTSRVYPRMSDFTPVPVAEQLAQRDADDIRLAEKETEQGRLWVAAAVDAIVEVARQCRACRVLVGLGMPGLKTPDGRGISVINNGPRIPGYLDALEKGLAVAGVGLASPVDALGSDADYCGLGEEYAAEGLFRGVENAYYVGCGTGIADAMKLRGKLVPFDEAKAWIQKSWQIPSALGPTFEKLISANSLNRVYANLVAAGPRAGREALEQGTEAQRHEGTKRDVAAGRRAGRSGSRPRAAGTTPPEADRLETGPTRATGHYPELAAAAGDPLAVAWLDTAALVLAELIFERLWTIKNGRADAPHRGEAYGKLDPNHEYVGLLLDRVIIGQRVGQIYADPAYRRVFGGKVDAYLAAFIGDSNDAELAKVCLSSDKRQLKPGLVAASRLRAAPALGAAVAAVRALRDSQATGGRSSG